MVRNKWFVLVMGVLWICGAGNNRVQSETKPAQPAKDERASKAQAGGKGQNMTIQLPGGVELKLVRIPAGEFWMGSSKEEAGRETDEGPRHKVTIPKAFYLGVYEVTQEQWVAVMGVNPANFSGNPKYPVESISWDHCQIFLEKLNQLGQGTFRLPTEAEWEYACRAGTETRYYWGDDPEYKKIGPYAWYDKNSGGKTQKVGKKKPNPWGLYDMCGNVWEWCFDLYRPYPGAEAVGLLERLAGEPAGEDQAGFPDEEDLFMGDLEMRILRGGGWDSAAVLCRSALRYDFFPFDPEQSEFGLRVARDE